MVSTRRNSEPWMYYGVLNLIVGSSRVKMCGCGYFKYLFVHTLWFWCKFVCSKNATNLSPLSFLSLSIVCDSQRPPIPATYLKFRLGLTNHHISLRSKRFLLVSEQRKTEAQDFRFRPRENGFTIRINGKSQVALFFAILLLRLCFFVLLLLIPSLL